MTHGERLPFRTWLVKQLTLTRWAPRAMDLSRSELAEQLGVTESVLGEALALRDQAMEVRGRPKRKLGRRARGRLDYEVARIVLPPRLLVDLEAYLTELRISKAALLRSLLHRCLSAGERPSTLPRVWIYRGERCVIDDRSTAHGVKTRIPRGAMIALDHYAEEWNVPSTFILRGLIIDFLDGRTTKLHIVAFRELWGDPDRYIHPEKFDGAAHAR